MGVLFPAFSTSLVQDPRRAALLFGRGVKYVFLAMFPITLLIITFANEGLYFWLGAKFAQNSTQLLQWIAAGVFIHSLGQIPYALIQGAGRPDLVAKLHLVELPFYVVILWWLIITNGIVGAAIAWVARIAVDTVFLFSMVRRVLPTGARIMHHKLLIMGLAVLAAVQV